MSLQSALLQLASGRHLPADAMHAAIAHIMDGGAEPAQVAALLTALHLRGETVDEIVGAAQAMRERAVCIRTARTGLLDTCGTGGSRLDTFNISTAAALVAAAAGVPVAKHGNRAATSTSGSADVLEALGVNVEIPPDQVGRCIDELGIGFCYARLCHQAMKHVAPIRSQLPFRTIFNLLGPLTNPARARHQVLGVFAAELTDRLASVLRGLGSTRAWVVNAVDGLDELSTPGPTRISELKDGEVHTRSFDPRDVGIAYARLSDLQVNSVEEAAEALQRVLQGETGPRYDIAALNAAAALVVAERAADLRGGLALACEAIDSGKARQTLQSLITHSNAG
jgi:anthranilate phosphoribosyltransferase